MSRGVVVVAAAGNYVSNEPVYPASYPGVLSVAASTDQGSVDPANGGPYLDFSEYGAAANIAAPGVNVLSTWNDGNYAVDSGTSMAAPHVAAAAALVMAADPSLTGPQVATLLQATASPLATGSYPINGGFLNVGAAVTAAAARRSPGALDGYEVVSGDGKAYSYGSATEQGALAGKPQARAVVGAAEDPNGLGYWLVSASGQVFAFGRARSYGSARKGQLRSPVVAMTASPDGLGYWLVSADGELLAFGNANFYGAPAFHLNKPIVGIAATPDGGGYWLVARDGGVFAYGDARYHGSIGHTRLNQPIVGMAAGRNGKGYWLVGADGGVFAFGDARFYGSAAAGVLNKPIVGIAASPYGLGYWLAGAGGAVFSFGAAPAESTTSTKALSAPVVAITS